MNNASIGIAVSLSSEIPFSTHNTFKMMYINPHKRYNVHAQTLLYESLNFKTIKTGIELIVAKTNVNTNPKIIDIKYLSKLYFSDNCIIFKVCQIIYSFMQSHCKHIAKFMQSHCKRIIN